MTKVALFGKIKSSNNEGSDFVEFRTTIKTDAKNCHDTGVKTISCNFTNEFGRTPGIC